MLVSSVSYSQSTDHLHYHFEEKLKIGSNEPVYMFATPRFVATDSENNIYIGDTRYLSVRAYDSQGKFLHDIGSRGRGPGEYSEISYMFTDSNDNLIIFDRSNLRISRFDLNGNIIGYYNFPDDILITPLQVSQLNDHSYLILAYMFSFENILGPKKGKLLHITDNSFKTYKTSFLSASSIGDVKDKFYNYAIGGSRTAHFSIIDENNIIITPFLYNRESYTYVNKNGDWKKKSILNGFAHKDQSHTIVHGDRDENPRAISLGTPEGRISAILHNECLGVFTLNNQQILVFTFNDNNGKKEHGISLFNPNGKFLGYSKIKEFGDKIIENHLPGILPVHIDKNDNIYFVNRSETPNIIKAKFIFDNH